MPGRDPHGEAGRRAGDQHLSIAGHNGGAPTTPHYGPAKAAVGLVAPRRSLRKGHHVNTVAPGVIDNRLHKVHTAPEPSPRS